MKLLLVILMGICALFTSAAQILYKFGVDDVSYLVIFLGLISYGVGFLFFLAALRGGKVAVLYPVVASSYIWVALGSSYFFNEVVNAFRWTGIVFIILGISLVSFGGGDD